MDAAPDRAKLRGVAVIAAVIAMLGVFAREASATPTITRFPLPARVTAGDIAAGSDGALWFTDSANNKIGRITTKGAVKEFSIPTANSGPVAIAAGPGGALWFTESNVDKIGRITTSGVASELAAPAGAGLFDIVEGPDGNLWFTEESKNSIGRMTPTGAVTEFPLTSHGTSFPTAITVGPDGRLYFIETNSVYIGRITVTNPTVTEFALPANYFPTDIAPSPDGSGVWFSDFNQSHLGHITTGGTYSQYDAPNPGNEQGIAAGPDGADWYLSTFGTPRVGRISPAGAITEYPIAGGSFPSNIAAGPDGAMWFTDTNASYIGRVSVDLPAAPRQGPPGPTGLPGPPGATGLPGPPGLTIRTATLIVIAYQATSSQSKVVVRYALTTPATLKLTVRGRNGKTVDVATQQGNVGVGRIVWKRKLHGKRAPAGHYLLTLTAEAGGERVTSQVRVRLR